MQTSARESPAVLAILAVIVLAGLGLRVGYAADPPATAPPDAGAYERIGENLYRGNGFDTRPGGLGREVQPSSAYSPGLPLLVAGLYLLSGGVHTQLALIVLALIGALAVPLTYLLGRRFLGPVAGLIGAGAIAIYPALLQYQGLLLTEPLAATLVAGSLCAFLHCAARNAEPAEAGGGRDWLRWAAAGALLGLLALVRPEYLILALGLPLLWAAWTLVRRFRPHIGAQSAATSRRRGLAAPVAASILATCLVLAPWTIHNAVSLGRFVPISTGGGKALYIGTSLDGNGDSVGVREHLLDERPPLRAEMEAGGPVDDPGRMVLERVLARVAAAAHPGMETDAALGRLGREQLGDDIAEHPLRFAEMLVSKAYETWTDAARSVMLEQPWRTLQLAIAILALVGLGVLVARGRRFEALVAGVVLLYMTAIGALLIASPRRELVVLPLLAALAGATGTAALGWLIPRIRPRTSA